MTLCGVIGEIITLVRFGKNAVAASRESLLLYKNERNE